MDISLTHKFTYLHKFAHFVFPHMYTCKWKGWAWKERVVVAAMDRLKLVLWAQNVFAEGSDDANEAHETIQELFFETKRGKNAPVPRGILILVCRSLLCFGSCSYSRQKTLILEKSGDQPFRVWYIMHGAAFSCVRQFWGARQAAARHSHSARVHTDSHPEHFFAPKFYPFKFCLTYGFGVRRFRL